MGDESWVRALMEGARRRRNGGGFLQEDFIHVAQLLIDADDRDRQAILSNNFNLIVAALDIAAAS